MTSTNLRNEQLNEFAILRASLSLRWSCNHILSALPLPATPAFRQLLKGLEPYGLAPQDVSAEVPGNRLSDVALVVLVARQAISIRITYSGFEITIPHLLEEHLPFLAPIAEVVMTVLREIDHEADSGKLRFSYNAHAKLKPGLARQMLNSHLTAGPGLVPDAFAYNVRAEDRSDILDMRLVIARSLFFEEALFIDFMSEYGGMGVPAAAAKKIGDDYYAVLAKLNMQLRTQKEAQ